MKNLKSKFLAYKILSKEADLIINNKRTIVNTFRDIHPNYIQIVGYNSKNIENTEIIYGNI